MLVVSLILLVAGVRAQCAFDGLTFVPPEFSYTVRNDPGNAGDTCKAGQNVPDGEGCYITKAGHTCHQPKCSGTTWYGVDSDNVDCWSSCAFDNLLLPASATATGGGAFTSGPGSLQSHSASDVNVFCSATNSVPDGAMCAVSKTGHTCTTAQCRQGVWNHITCSETCIAGNGCASRVPATFTGTYAYPIYSQFEECVDNPKGAGAEAWPWLDPVGAATCAGGVQHSANTAFASSRCNEWTVVDPVASEGNCGIRAMVYLYESASSRGTGDLTGPAATCTGCGAGSGFIMISGKDPASEGQTATVTSSEYNLDCYPHTMTIKYMLYMGNTASTFVDTASVKLYLSPDGTTWTAGNKIWEWDGSDRTQDCSGDNELMQCNNGANDWGTITATVEPNMHFFRFEMTMDDAYGGQAGKLDFAFDDVRFTRINPLGICKNTSTNPNSFSVGPHTRPTECQAAGQTWVDGVNPTTNPDPYVACQALHGDNHTDCEDEVTEAACVAQTDVNDNLCRWRSYTDEICDIFNTNDSQLRQSRDLGLWYWNAAGNFVDVAGSTVSTVDVKDQPWVECASYAHGCTVLMWTSDHHLCSNSNQGLLWMFKDVTDMFYMPPCPDPAGQLEMEVKVAVFRSCDVGKSTDACACEGTCTVVIGGATSTTTEAACCDDSVGDGAYCLSTGGADTNTWVGSWTVGGRCQWMGQDYREDIYHCVDIPAEPHRSRVTTFTVKASESDNCGAMSCSGSGLERYGKYGCEDLS